MVMTMVDSIYMGGDGWMDGWMDGWIHGCSMHGSRPWISCLCVCACVVCVYVSVCTACVCFCVCMWYYVCLCVCVWCVCLCLCDLMCVFEVYLMYMLREFVTGLVQLYGKLMLGASVE